GADAVAGALYHRISAADKIEQAVGIAPHPVARPYRNAAIARRRRCWAESFGSALCVLPIALRNQRAAMDQFALLPIRRHIAVIADHQNLGMGDSFAHRCRVTVDQRWIEIG